MSVLSIAKTANLILSKHNQVTMKNTILVLLLLAAGCSHRITGTVFGEHFPEGGAMVATDVSAKTYRTNESGFFSIKVKKPLPDSFFVFAWNPKDTARNLVVERYYPGGGRVHLRLRNK